MSSRKADYSPEAWEKHKQRERDRYKEKRGNSDWLKKRQAKIQLSVERKRKYLYHYKLRVGCTNCNTREGTLDFDHRPGTTKLFNLAHPRCSWQKLLEEIAKCDVRCHSCHAKRHAIIRWGNEVEGVDIWRKSQESAQKISG